MSLNVILPCAGAGTRLGLPYPKEIHLVARDTALIDFALSMCAAHAARIEAISIVLTPQKADIVRYLEKWKSTFRFRFCFFDPRYHEWAGSVRSAEALYGDKNLVLLPDSLIQEYREQPVAPTMDRLLDTTDVGFAYARETDPDRLRALGALRVERDGRVSLFCDKPDRDHQLYNGYWGAFGFRRAAAPALLDMMTSSIRRQNVDIAALGMRIGAFPLAGYRDLGTWPSLHRVMQDIFQRAAAAPPPGAEDHAGPATRLQVV